MAIFKKELEAKECAFATINYKSRDKSSSQFTSSALFNNSEKNLCIFCGGTTLHQNVEKYLILKLEKTFYSKTKFA